MPSRRTNTVVVVVMSGTLAWMAECGQRGTRALFHPVGALRDLAPAFKALEPQIEHLFWNSRYVGN